MKITCALSLLAVAFNTAFAISAASQQSGNVKPPFTLEISANLEEGQSELWDFAKTAEKVVSTGSMVVVGIKKTNRSDHEIARMSETGGAYGCRYEVRDSSGHLLGPKKPGNQNGWIVLGGPGRLRGTSDMVLQPGQTRLSSAPLSDWFDMSQPGTYSVQVSEHVSNDRASDVVKSNIITIKVLPSDALPSTQ